LFLFDSVSIHQQRRLPSIELIYPHQHNDKMSAAAPSKMALPPLQPPSAIDQARQGISNSFESHRRQHSPTSDAQRWHHLTTRTQPAQPFIYAVLTTKIYCLPTCPSRLARRANVSFFSTPSEAEQSGFRACKRCKPNESPSFASHRSSTASATTGLSSMGTTNITASSFTASTLTNPNSAYQTGSPSNSAQPQDGPNYDPTDPALPLHLALQHIRQCAAQGTKVSLAELADKVGLSKWHLQRAFKKKIGQSPREVGEELIREWERKREQEAGGSSRIKAGEGHLYSEAGIGSGAISPRHMDMDMNLHPDMGIGTSMGIGYDTPSLPFTSSQLDNFDMTGFETLSNQDRDPDEQRGPSHTPLLMASDLTESSSSYATTPAPSSATLSPPYYETTEYGMSELVAFEDDYVPDLETVLFDLFPELYKGTYEWSGKWVA
jgi:methylphosphotriester-DNA--protein-cysteine methyltransferase